VVLIIIVAVLVVGVAIAVFYYFTQVRQAQASPHESATSTKTPEEAATASLKVYLDAMVSGDASTMQTLLPNTSAGASSALLDNSVYSAATRPDDYTITAVAVHGDRASVTADIPVNGRPYAAEFTLAKDAHALNGWAIATGPKSSISVKDVQRVTRVNGVSVDLSKVRGTVALPALPGVYKFAAPDDTDAVRYEGADVTVVVAPGAAAEVRGAPLTFTPTLTEKGEQKAVAAVRAHVEKCMLSDAFHPKGCPNVLKMDDPVDWAVTQITRTWGDKPEYAFVAPAAGTSTSAPAYAVRITDGDMQVTYKWRFDEGDKWTPDAEYMNDVFDQNDSGGTLVPVTIDANGDLNYDYSAF
jgi:hypothetical protein